MDYEVLVEKEKRVEDVLPDLERKLSRQNEEVERETEVELKRKLPSKMVEKTVSNAEKEKEVPVSESDGSSKENEPVVRYRE